MAVTQNTYTGNGATVLYSFTFPYLETTDVKVTINGTPTTAYTFANATTIQFNTAPANGAAIRIYRDTDDASLAATFYSGSAIRAQDLNDNFTQNLYVTQEVNNNSVNIDGSNPMVGPLNMNGFQIDNLAEPTTDSDAATKKYIDDRYGNLGIPGHTRWRKVATASQTTFSGTGDYGGVLAYSPTREQVYINGALQQRGVDYVADNGTSIVFTVGLTVGDVVDIICVNNLTNSSVSTAGNITYSGQFTGQTARTVAAKLADVISVKDFGAVGDGVADDTAAIQAALNACKGADGTGVGASVFTLYFPQTAGGFYKITNTLVVDGTSGCVIQGSGGFTQREFNNAQIRWYGSSSKPMFQIKGDTGVPSNPNFNIVIRDLTLHGYKSTNLTPADATPADIALAGIYIGNLDGVNSATLQRMLLIENVVVHNCRFGIYSGNPDGFNTDHAAITLQHVQCTGNLQHGLHLGTGNTIAYVNNCFIYNNGYAATDFPADDYTPQFGTNVYVASGSTFIVNYTSAGSGNYAPHTADIYQAAGQISITNAWSDTEGYFFYQGIPSINSSGRHAGQITGVRHYNAESSFVANTHTSMSISGPGTVVSSCMVFGNIEVRSGLSGRPVFIGINFGDGPSGTGSGFVGSGINTQRSLINIGNEGNSAQILMGGTNATSGATLKHKGNKPPQILSVGTGADGAGISHSLMQWKGASLGSSSGTLAVDSFNDGGLVFWLNCYPTATGFTVENTSRPAARVVLSTADGIRFSTYDGNAGANFTDNDWVNGSSHVVPQSAGVRQEMAFKPPHRSGDPSFNSGDFWEGSVYYNTTTNKLRVNTGGSTWVDLH